MDDTEKQDGKLHRIRHSSAHLLAQAVKHLFPDVHMGIGPVIEDGFYYDFLRKEPFTPEDLKKISKKMKELVSAAQPINKIELKADEEKKFLAHESLKKELYDELKAKGEKPTFYGQGTFIDLCRGPHVENTKEMKLFALFDLIGKGLPVWLPKGEIIKSEVEKFALETEARAGYVRVSTPHLAKKELFMRSGHVPFYEDG